MTIVTLDTRQITDWDSFHEAFASAFGFPEYYGRNIDAWVDCMSYLNDPDVSETKIKAPPGEVVVLQLEYARDLAARCPELYAAIVDGAAFVNYRNVEQGYPPTLALAWQE